MPAEIQGKKTVTIYLDTDLAEKAKKVADRLDRSVNYFLVEIIRAALQKENG